MRDSSSIFNTTNINKLSGIQLGNFRPRGVITATDIGFPDSEVHLTRTLRELDYRDTLVTLARINVLLQRSEDSASCEKILRNHFCSPLMRDEIRRKHLDEHHIFNRAATLFLLSTRVAVVDTGATNSPDTEVDARNKLARCYLIANKLLYAKSSDSGTHSTEKLNRKILAESIISFEYATLLPPSSRSGNFLVRSEAYFRVFKQASTSSNVDVNEIFSKATGITLQDYQYLTWGILSQYLALSQEEILAGEGLFIDPNQYPLLSTLYGNFLKHNCLSIDKLALTAETISSRPNEFRLWREYPLVKIAENLVMCIDIGFLEDKLETGVFWIIHQHLKKEENNKRDKMLQLRGQGFENYTASIIQRSINSQAPFQMESYKINPNYNQKGDNQCTDIIVYDCNTLILLECKAPLIAASTKFCGDFCKFYNDLKARIVEPKGIKQLCNAILALGHASENKRRKIVDIDTSRVKKIFPVLVFSDRIFSFPLMNWFLNLEFQRLLRQNNVQSHLKIMPLTVMAIDDLERLEPYLSDTPFHEHLDRWTTQVFKRNPVSPFSKYFRSLTSKEARENTYIEQEVNRIHTDIMEYFAARGVE